MCISVHDEPVRCRQRLRRRGADLDGRETRRPLRDEAGLVHSRLRLRQKANWSIVIDRRAHRRHVARTHADRDLSRVAGPKHRRIDRDRNGWRDGERQAGDRRLPETIEGAVVGGSKPPCVHRAGQQQPPRASWRRHDHRQRSGRIGVGQPRDYFRARRGRRIIRNSTHAAKPPVRRSASRVVRAGVPSGPARPDTTGKKTRPTRPRRKFARGARLDALMAQGRRRRRVRA